MIRELVLERFGKFAQARFGFGRCTVFAGPNEAGKTTLFDALARELCKVSGSTTFGKALVGRYGVGAQAALVFAPGHSPPGLDVADFFGLHAVRSGDIVFGDGDEQRKWLGQLKARLFASGVDVAALAAALEAQASDNKTRKHNKHDKTTGDALEAALAKQSELVARRTRVLAAEQHAAHKSLELGVLERELAGAEERAGALAVRVSAARRAREVERLGREVRELRELARSARAAASMRAFTEDALGEYDALAQAHAERERETSVLVGQRQQLVAARERLSDEVEVLAASEARQAKLAVRATPLRERLAAWLRTPALVTLYVWRAPVLVAAGAALVAGLSCATLAEGALRLAGLLFGLALGAALAAVARRRVSVLDAAAEQRLVTELCNEWNVHAPSVRLEPGAGVTLMGFFDAVHREHDAAVALVAAKRAEIASAAQGLARLDSLLGDGRVACASADERARAWLRARDCATRDVFVTHVVERREFEQRGVELRARLAVPALAPAGLDERADELAREHEALVGSGPAAELLPSAVATRLERERDAADGVVQQCRAKHAELRQSIERARGEVRGATQALGEELAACDASVLRYREELAAGARRKRGAGIAAGLFRELASADSGQMADLLVVMRPIVCQVLGRDTVELSDLSARGFGVVDALGTVRALADLSRGTRDALALAARLALCERLGGAAPVLILDEPFLAFDVERERLALEMLRDFQIRAGWQLVVFTKEQRVREAVVARFAGAVVHDLTTTAAETATSTPFRPVDELCGRQALDARGL